MTISAISVYAVVDITQADRSYIQKMEAVNQ
jgi:hypothetical protein